MLGLLKKTPSADETPTPGPFGRFYLQELINRGGMADIWLATDERQKPYALRRMHQRLRFNLLARRRFVRGAEILSRITDHDGIVGYEINAEQQRDVRRDVARAIVDRGMGLLEMRPMRMSLEDIFLQLTTNEQQSDPAAPTASVEPTAPAATEADSNA